MSEPNAAQLDAVNRNLVEIRDLLRQILAALSETPAQALIHTERLAGQYRDALEQIATLEDSIDAAVKIAEQVLAVPYE